MKVQCNTPATEGGEEKRGREGGHEQQAERKKEAGKGKGGIGLLSSSLRGFREPRRNKACRIGSSSNGEEYCVSGAISKFPPGGYLSHCNKDLTITSHMFHLLQAQRPPNQVSLRNGFDCVLLLPACRCLWPISS